MNIDHLDRLITYEIDDWYLDLKKSVPGIDKDPNSLGIFKERAKHEIHTILVDLKSYGDSKK